MQLLIVHHDAEVGEELVRMVTDYTEHHCGYASSGAGALEWAGSAARCSLLISQLDGEGVNGLSLAATMSDMFAGMQTMFLPDYPATEQRVEVPQPRIFPEPIDGQLLLDAIACAEAQRQTGMDLYHPLDVVQMCCLTLRSGALQFVRGSNAAVLFLRSGNIVHAESGAARGIDALAEIATWDAAEFAYDYAMRAPVETIKQPWDEAVAASVNQQRVETVASIVEPATPVQKLTTGEAKAARRGLFGARKVGLLACAGLLPLIVC